MNNDSNKIETKRNANEQSKDRAIDTNYVRSRNFSYNAKLYAMIANTD